MDGWMDRWIDGQTDRTIDMYLHVKSWEYIYICIVNTLYIYISYISFRYNYIYICVCLNIYRYLKICSYLYFIFLHTHIYIDLYLYTYKLLLEVGPARHEFFGVCVFPAPLSPVLSFLADCGFRFESEDITCANRFVELFSLAKW